MPAAQKALSASVYFSFLATKPKHIQPNSQGIYQSKLVQTWSVALRERDVTRSDKQTENSMQSLLLYPQQQCLVVTIQTATKDKD